MTLANTEKTAGREGGEARRVLEEFLAAVARSDNLEADARLRQGKTAGTVYVRRCNRDGVVLKLVLAREIWSGWRRATRLGATVNGVPREGRVQVRLRQTVVRDGHPEDAAQASAGLAEVVAWVDRGAPPEGRPGQEEPA